MPDHLVPRLAVASSSDTDDDEVARSVRSVAEARGTLSADSDWRYAYSSSSTRWKLGTGLSEPTLCRKPVR